ncbi:MAG: S1C family serine protease, partial [Clostridia bacterium]|nr:S1C family serine protease [Clostridia bacterium]
MRKFRIVVSLLILVGLLGILLTGCNLASFVNDGTLGRITDGGSITDPNNNTDDPGGSSNLGGTLNGADNLADFTLEATLPATNDTRTLPDIIEDVQDSVVVINVTMSNGTSAGSGVIIAKSASEGYSYLMTCLHVVEGHTEIEIILTNGKKYNAEFVGGVPDSDIALLRMNIVEGITIAEIRDVEAKPVRIGEDAIAIGNPLGTLGGTVTKGIISAITREINIDGSVMTLLQTDAAVNSGNSGGALFDASGLLMGIVNAKSVGTSVEGLGFAIPIETAVELAQQLLDTRGNTEYNGLGYIPGKKMLGITTVSGNFDLGGTDYYASQVTQMNLYGSAVASGLTVDDYIIEADGEALSESRTLGDILGGKNIGDTLTLTVLRREAYSQGWLTQYRYNEHTITITLRQYVYG